MPLLRSTFFPPFHCWCIFPSYVQLKFCAFLMIFCLSVGENWSQHVHRSTLLKYSPTFTLLCFALLYFTPLAPTTSFLHLTQSAKLPAFPHIPTFLSSSQQTHTWEQAYSMLLSVILKRSSVQGRSDSWSVSRSTGKMHECVHVKLS